MVLFNKLKDKVELHRKRDKIRRKFGLTWKGLREFEKLSLLVYENSGINLLNLEICDLTGEDLDGEE